MLRQLMVFGLMTAFVARPSAAQDTDHRYEVGIRSGLITGSMNLSGLDPAFGDLSPDGPKGAHMSGFYFMYRLRPHVRIGVETLVANADQDARTTMNYQAAGPVVELSYGATWFVSGGVHAGGLIVNAMSRPGPAPLKGATTGSYFKGDGYFLSPYVDVGYRFRRAEVGMFIKKVNTFGETERGGMSAFGSSFVGLRFAIGL
ncbi:MAG: hypothetical protein HY260_13595 [Chloroflexi bacterium]|nr:hypothetical protein [Chloroflexota bacterium]